MSYPDPPRDPFGSPPPSYEPPPGGTPPPPPPSATPPPPPAGYQAPAPQSFGAPPPGGGYGAPPGGFGAPPPGGYGAPQPSGQPGYGQPAYSQPNPTNGLAIGSLITGILSLFCMFPLGFVGVGLGIAGLGKAKKTNGSGRGLAIGGIVTGALGILATIVFAILILTADTSGINSDPSDGICNRDRFLEDPDC